MIAFILRRLVQSVAVMLTVGLMGAIPVLGERRDRLQQIEGAMPRLAAIPAGCAFHPRCAEAFARCHDERPEPLPAGASDAACWLHAGRADG